MSAADACGRERRAGSGGGGGVESSTVREREGGVVFSRAGGA